MGGCCGRLPPDVAAVAAGRWVAEIEPDDEVRPQITAKGFYCFDLLMVAPFFSMS